MKFSQQPVVFDCGKERLLGIVSRPEQCLARGVLVVVGGPQYRVGSHRQFLLLATALASAGVSVMRFDYRGMGDSSGEARNFERVASDVRAAVDVFFRAVPELREVVIWGLCDAASAALFYAHSDSRVCGLALLNPWVRTVQGEAKAYLKHYYLKRLLNTALWRKILRGEFKLRDSWNSLAGSLRNARGASNDNPPVAPDTGRGPTQVAGGPLPKRMADGLARFGGRVLLILSGNDLTAKEFIDMSNASRQWRQLLSAPRVTRHCLPEATHTFSSRAWRDQVAAWTLQWVKSW